MGVQHQAGSATTLGDSRAYRSTHPTGNNLCICDQDAKWQRTPQPPCVCSIEVPAAHPTWCMGLTLHGGLSVRQDGSPSPWSWLLQGEVQWGVVGYKLGIFESPSSRGGLLQCDWGR